MWDAFLLALAGFFSTFKTAVLAKRHYNLEYLGFALAALFFTVGQGGFLLDLFLDAYGLTIYPEAVEDWSNIIAISFVLSGLAVLIRESKPVFAQFPFIYTVVPLLLIVSYWLVKDTLAIKELLMAIYQGGALLVALLMYGVQSYRMNQFSLILVSILFFLITFILYWFVPGVRNNYTWIWQIFMGLSLITAAFGLKYSLNSSKTEAGSGSVTVNH